MTNYCLLVERECISRALARPVYSLVVGDLMPLTHYLDNGVAAVPYMGSLFCQLFLLGSSFCVTSPSLCLKWLVTGEGILSSKITYLKEYVQSPLVVCS